MTREEAGIVARVCLTADEGCTTCVDRLFGRLIKHLPDQAHIFQEVLDQLDRDVEVKGLW